MLSHLTYRRNTTLSTNKNGCRARNLHSIHACRGLWKVCEDIWGMWKTLRGAYEKKQTTCNFQLIVRVDVCAYVCIATCYVEPPVAHTACLFASIRRDWEMRKSAISFLKGFIMVSLQTHGKSRRWWIGTTGHGVIWIFPIRKLSFLKSVLLLN